MKRRDERRLEKAQLRADGAAAFREGRSRMNGPSNILDRFHWTSGWDAAAAEAAAAQPRCPHCGQPMVAPGADPKT